MCLSNTPVNDFQGSTVFWEPLVENIWDFIFSSLELKVQVSFADHLLSVVCLFFCLYVCM